MSSEFDYTQTDVFNRAKLGPWEAYDNTIYSAVVEDGFGRFRLAECVTSQIATYIVSLHNHSLYVHRRIQEEAEREERRRQSRRPQGRRPDLVWKYRDPRGRAE